MKISHRSSAPGASQVQISLPRNSEAFGENRQIRKQKPQTQLSNRQKISEGVVRKRKLGPPYGGPDIKSPTGYALYPSDFL